jgi:hypothetical protein
VVRHETDAPALQPREAFASQDVDARLRRRRSGRPDGRRARRAEIGPGTARSLSKGIRRRGGQAGEGCGDDRRDARA